MGDKPIYFSTGLFANQAHRKLLSIYKVQSIKSLAGKAGEGLWVLREVLVVGASLPSHPSSPADKSPCGYRWGLKGSSEVLAEGNTAAGGHIYL